MIGIATMGKFDPPIRQGISGGGTYIKEVEVERRLPSIVVRHVDKEDKKISFKINKIEED